ncbi:MAG: glutaredoxin 3 [Candidatus Sericytochromatia bacterium]
MQKKVVVYTKDYCSYCTRAINLLKKKNIEFEEIDITDDSELQEYVIDRTGRYTVPQIIIGEHDIGGYDDLYLLNSKGELDKLLFQEI